MTIHVLHEAPPPPLRDALMEFERQFVYPLGPRRTFRIDHGEDYPRFYRAIGDGRCFVCEEAGRVLGVVAVALRPVQVPGGDLIPVAYVGDVKVAPGPRRGAMLLRLARAAETWCRLRVARAFGVVMDGTPVVPTTYTGRLGIPAFAEVARVIVIRFLCNGVRPCEDRHRFSAVEKSFWEVFHRLAEGAVFCPSSSPTDRSLIEPAWLVDERATACGCLEDTSRAKRLIADDGMEMRSAHLSSFAYHDIASGASLLRHAIGRAAVLGFPALFTAVAALDAEELLAALTDVEAVRAPATVFAHGFAPGPVWIVNSSEI
jgi:hypothetical protein